ncbi:4'-phosphopantetheinyl transferase superfamily protein [Streptomyces sp. NPDC041068]|uniref:4'-phosphopantetheinyl transferase family protein n=1 Tax=Streptomyces sp. NPDC041068 TaxID=3155130 RepID=UPI0033E65938
MSSSATPVPGAEHVDRAAHVVCHVWGAAPLPAPHRFLPLLGDAERARFAAYAHEGDRARFVTGRMLAKAALSHELGTDLESVVLRAQCPDCGGPHGKPRPQGAAADWELSISHSEDRVLVAVAQGGPIGLDVEELAAPVDLAAPGDADEPAEAALVLTPAEREALRALPPGARRRAFLTYWTRKEAVLKATGHGLAVPMTDFTVSAPDRPAALVEWNGPGGDSVRAVLTDLTDQEQGELALGDAYLATLAVLGTAPVEVRAHSGAERIAAAVPALR